MANFLISVLCMSRKTIHKLKPDRHIQKWNNSVYYNFSTLNRAIITKSLDNKRNIGISAHIDSGKTTLTERILFYTGRIKKIHEVRGSDGVGAKMDSMELEREKGITIQSAATNCLWSLNDSFYEIDIIDTPGHVDFTIEVERALRVLDGGVLVCCGVSGVQSQTMTVDRQMKRYNVPRITFINKLDRDGADPDRVIKLIRKKLSTSTAALHVPIGLEGKYKGVIDVISRKAHYFEGIFGENIQIEEVPQEYIQKVESTRSELLEILADIDDQFAEIYLEGDDCSISSIYEAIRRTTINRLFSPVLMGSARTNKGVQLLLDAICRYLPSPDESLNQAFDQENNEEVVDLICDPKLPFVGLAFKIQDQNIGQITYLRVYQGSIKKGDSILNISTKKKVSVKKLYKMHADEAKECSFATSGDIVAIGGIECDSGTTFTDGKLNLAMYPMYVPDPVVSWSIKPKLNSDIAKFNKSIQKFQREDPTFRISIDQESKEVIMSGMGELQLEIYVERIKRESNIDVIVGEPKVNFRETVTNENNYNYTHKKQTGGAGQYGKIIGKIEPINSNDPEFEIAFENRLLGNQISPGHIVSIEKGFRESCQRGLLSGSPVINTRFILIDGASHPVDSSDLAFRSAAQGAFKEAYKLCSPVILEPIMKIEVIIPREFQSAGLASLIKRKATIQSTENQLDDIIILATVGLKDMFGYISDLRASTQGQGNFSMEFERYSIMNTQDQNELIRKYETSKALKT